MFNTREDGKYIVIEMEGDVDLSCSPMARKQILSCLEGEIGVLIDLSRVSYIDSSGIACLVEGYQTAKIKELDFGLVGVSEAVMNVLQLAKLDKVFTIHPDANSAS
jgi:anti-sigma B factor antagonist